MSRPWSSRSANAPSACSERLQYWFGPLNAQQRQRVLRWAHTLSEQNSRWLRNREQWQAMLLAAVEQRHGADFDKRIARLCRIAKRC